MAENGNASSTQVTTSATFSNPALRVAGVGLAAVFLALPLAYLAMFRAHPQAVLAGSMPAQVQTTTTQLQTPSPDLASLEAAVKEKPTAANRLDLSMAYINANEPDRALSILLSLVAEDKSNANAWNNLCVANTLRKSYTVAVEDCHKAVELEPNMQLARNNLRWAEDEKSKAMLALASDQQTPTASHDAAFYVAEGLSQLNTGHLDEAIVSWQRALEFDPQNALAANNIGDAYMLKKQPDIALQWFQKASIMDPTLLIAKNNMAWAIEEKSKAK